MVLKPEQLSEMFGAIARPTAALSLEAAIDAHLNIPFNQLRCRDARARACARFG